MAALPLIPGAYQVTTFGTIRGMPCDHVINYTTLPASPDPLHQCQALALSDAVAWMPTMEAFLPSYYVHTSSRAIYLGDLAVPEATHQVGQAGTGTAALLAPQTCVTFRHPVPVRGRGKQGRTNMPGPQVTAYTEATGQLSSNGLATYTAAWNAYQQAIATELGNYPAAQVSLIVVDRKLGTYNTPGATFVDNAVNTHRRWEKRLSRHR